MTGPAEADRPFGPHEPPQASRAVDSPGARGAAAASAEPGRPVGAVGAVGAVGRADAAGPARAANPADPAGTGESPEPAAPVGRGPATRTGRDGQQRRPRYPLRLRRGAVSWQRQRPTWREARPAVIGAALKAARARPSGNWYVLAASREIRPGRRPFSRTVGGLEVVAWRGGDGRVHAGPGACPHLGAPLACSPVHEGRLVCHWHGLALDGSPFAGWEPYPAHDDGVLVWVRLDEAGGEEPLERPVVPVRPEAAETVDAVLTVEGVCEPEDVIANRLDPWHGAWFHPYSFVDLAVEESPREDGRASRDGFAVRVSFRLAGRLVVPVRAVFTAPEPRTVVMHLTEGEGETSVVETHATPLGADERGRPRTAVIEAVLATSGRRGFAVARRAAPVLRPLMRAAAGRLWRDDMAYAERRRLLRSTGRFPG